MVRKTAVLYLAMLIAAAIPARGDFKYSESSQMTGGAMAGMVKFMGAFSKQARQATAPTENVTYIKGNRLRKDLGTTSTEIIDLQGRRLITIDHQKRTYSVTMFEQMKQAMEAARAKMQSQKASQPQGQQPPPNLQVKPKIEVTPTGKTATLLSLPTNEVLMNLDMEMQSTDPRSQGQSATMWVKSDAWVTPKIPGYEEVTAFHQKMAKELDWMPGEILGGNPQVSQGMSELQKNASALKGFPLLQYVSMGMAASGQAAGAQPEQQQTQQSQSSTPSSPEGAIVKGLGGMFGGFGHKKKKQEQAQESSGGGQTAGEPAAPPSTPGALMEMTVRVTSYSNDSLDSGLFEVPAGYTQVQSDMEKELSGTK